jgi:hypothetical protein
MGASKILTTLVPRRAEKLWRFLLMLSRRHKLLIEKRLTRLYTLREEAIQVRYVVGNGPEPRFSFQVMILVLYDFVFGTY